MSAASAAMLALVLTGMHFSAAIAESVATILPDNYRKDASFVVLTLGFFAMRFCGQGMLTLSSRNMVLESIYGTETRNGAGIHRDIRRLWFFDDAALFRMADPERRLVVGLAVDCRDRGCLFVGCILLWWIETGRPRLDAGRPLRKGNSENACRNGERPTFHAFRSSTNIQFLGIHVQRRSIRLSADGLHVSCRFHFCRCRHAARPAVAIFVPAACVSVMVEFVGSWLSDFIKLKYLAMVQLVGIIMLSLSLSFLDDGPSTIFVVLGMGLMQGMFGIISAVTWPRFYGRTHLGARYSGFSTSIVVAGTAIGPYLFSVVHEQFGAYRPATVLCAIIAVVLLAASPRADRPQ